MKCGSRPDDVEAVGEGASGAAYPHQGGKTSGAQMRSRPQLQHAARYGRPRQLAPPQVRSWDPSDVCFCAAAVSLWAVVLRTQVRGVPARCRAARSCGNQEGGRAPEADE